jgi:hypothetical protein
MPTPRRRQTPVDQIERLANGCCPVHGLFMPQVGSWYQRPGTAWFTIVECPRRDCQQRATAYSVDGPWEAWEGPVPERKLCQLGAEGGRPLLEVYADELASIREHLWKFAGYAPGLAMEQALIDEIYERATEL